MGNSEDSKLENVLRKLAIGLGIALLLASIYLSYDGFDQSVSGDNPNYTLLAQAIGLAIAITFNVLEFIIASRNENLSTTLRVLGIFAYGYSIYTNYLGAQHLLQMDKGMAAIVGVFMDVVPEPMIAWGLGEAVMHDLFGNLGKFATAPISPKKNSGGGGGGQGQGKQKQNQQPQQQQRRPDFQYRPAGGGGFDPRHNGSQRRSELEKSRGNGHNRQFANLNIQEDSGEDEG